MASIQDRINKAMQSAASNDLAGATATRNNQYLPQDIAQHNQEIANAAPGTFPTVYIPQKKQEDVSLNKHAPYGMEYKDGKLQIKEGYEADPVTGFVLPTTKTALENIESEKYILPSSLLQGSDRAATAISSTLDWLLGKPLQTLGWENNPISALNEKLQEERKQNEVYFSKKMEGDPSSQLLSEIGSNVVAAVPNAVLAAATAGSSAAAQATTKGLEAASAAASAATGSKIAQSAQSAISSIKNLATNPQAWLSFSQVAGPSYDQAIEDGASELKASAYAVINGLLNTQVEIGGGGIQSLPDEIRQGGSTLRKWVDTMIDEGKEEAVQGIIERLAQNVVYGKGNQLFSVTDPNAVFNPLTSAQEAGMGALVGGILGGAQIGASNVLSPDASRQRTNAEIFAQESELNTQPQTTVETQAETTATQPRTVADIINSGNVSTNAANTIIENPQLKAEFEAISGTKLTGTKSEQRTFIKAYAAQMSQDVASQTQQNITPAEQAAQAQTQPASQALAEGATTDRITQRVNLPDAGEQTILPEFNGHSEQGDIVTNRENALRGALGEQYEGPGVHERLSNQDSVAFAQAKLNADYEGEVSNLRDKQQWDAIDTDAAFLVLKNLADKAMASGNSVDNAALRDWTNLVRQRATTAGQSLQSFSKWREFTPESAYADAVDILYGKDVRRGMKDEQKQQVLQQTKEAAERLENIDANDTESTIELIKQLSQQRRTTGLLRNDTSRIMNSALQQVAQQEGGAEFLRNVAQSQIRRLAQDYQRSSFTERIRTIRNLNMLSKPATTLRNFVGNGIFDPLESISNNTGVVLDWFLSSITGQRTTAMDKSWFSAAKRRGSTDALMRSIVEIGLDADASGTQNRYEQGGGRTFRMSGNFIERLLSTWEKFNGYALTSTDEFAKGGTRAEAERGLRSLAERNKLVDAREAQAAQRKHGRNVLPEGTVVRALDRNNFGNIVSYNAENDTYIVHFESREGYQADVELPASQVVDTKAAGKARRLAGGRDSSAAQRAQLSTEDYITQRAEQIAKERTFQNDSLASDITLGLRDVANLAHVGDIGAGDVLIPFARVPANVATQAINYSPVGLANGIRQVVKVIRAAHNDTLTPQQQAQAVMSVGRGFTGTTAIAAFAGLALQGILNVAGSDDDDERAFDTGENLSGTQFNLSAAERWLNGESVEWQDGDTLISIGFLEPINAQMAMGAMIAESYLEDGTLSVRDILNATVEGTMQSIIDLPAMSSIQELLDAWEYSSGEDTTERLVNAATAYAGSQATSFVIPNIVAGVAAGLDQTVRAPYLGDTAAEDTYYQFLNDIPFARENVPARLDSWGYERQYTDSEVMNFLNNTILPGSVTQYRTSEVNQQLRALGTDALPDNAPPNSFTVDNKKITLDQEQKAKYQKVYGQSAYGVIEDMLDSDVYSSLNKQEKIDAVKKAYSYATALAKASLSDYEPESWVEEARGAKSVGLDVSTYVAVYGPISDIKGKKESNEPGASSIANSQGLKRLQYLYSLDLTDDQRIYLAEAFDVGKTVRYYTEDEVNAALAEMNYLN